MRIFASERQKELNNNRPIAKRHIYMSIESIIGITSGLIGIVSAVCGRIIWMRNKLKEIPTSELFNQLTQKDLRNEECRKILRKLNKSTLLNNRIKDNYIQNFALENRKREAVFFDICDSNDIEPTYEICKGLLNYDSASLRNKYQQKRGEKGEVLAKATVSMSNQGEKEELPIQQGKQIVYMSELLKTKFPQTCSRLVQILEKHNVKYNFLKGTKDIWCRDYLPIQTKSGKLIQFKYDPSYLKGNKELEETRSDVKKVCKDNNIKAQFSDINLDGGNVLICEDRAILSDRLFSENPNKSKEDLLNELKELLECNEIIIIPALRSKEEDFTGHADGMVRFVNRNTLIGNRLADEYQYIQKGMKKVLDEYGMEYIDMPFFVTKDREHPDSAIGIYINYLEVNNLIVMPIFGRDEDNVAYDIIQKTFPNKIIERIDYNDVALEGGLLNCTTWVVTP